MTVRAASTAPLPRPSSELQICVVIPARDEAAHITAALQSLAGQRDLSGAPLGPTRFEVLLGCNNCRDQTAQIARDFADAHPQLRLHILEWQAERHDASVGAARRFLMDAACARLEMAPGVEPRAIASTDADTRVSPTWIAAILAEIAAGAEAVGGRILVAGEGCGKAERAIYLRDTAYRLAAARLENLIDPQSADPMPRHFQFFGACFAITPRAYALVGGLPRVPCLEDVALERALNRADITVRHSPHVRALTSARHSGRVEIGLSTQLREWRQRDAENREWLVPSAPELCARFSARRALRALHACTSSGQNRDADLGELGRELRLNPRWLVARTHTTPAFGALWNDVERALDSRSLFRAQWPPIPVEVALAQLRARLEGVAEK